MRSVVFLLVLSMLCGSVWAAGGDMGGEGPNGSEAYPYLIQDFFDFQEFRSNFAYWASGVHIRMESDIDLNPVLPGRQTYTNAVITSIYVTYAGHFDGNDHAICACQAFVGPPGNS